MRPADQGCPRPPQDSPGAPQDAPGTPGPDAEEPGAAGPDEDRGGLRAEPQASSSTPPHSSPPTGGAAEVERDLAELLEDAEQKRDEYLDLAKRTQADFENYRKRMAAEVQAASARGKIEVAREVIDAVDNLERALETGGDGTDLATGVGMVLSGLRETLTRHGIEALERKGEKFDPQWHEALSAQAVEGAEPGTVIETMQKGYRLGEQLIRPARVVVSE